MVDADNEPENTWQTIRNVCLPSIPDFPENLAETGLKKLSNKKIFFASFIKNLLQKN